MIPQHTLDDSVSTADSRRTRWDDRAVSEILGAILLFALVVLLIALIQLNAVPAANQQVEFEHNQRVQGDLQEFQEVFFRSATTDTDGTVAIEAGTGYPSRFFLFNPPSPTGTVAVSDGGDITITNAVGAGETRDYLDGTQKTFATRFMTYTPNYNEYRNPPTTVYENGVLYNEFETGQQVVSERSSFVNGRTISLVALQGEYAVGTSGSLSLETTPISAPAQEVSVTTETGSPTDDPIVINIPTRLSADEWRDILDDELQSNGGYILPITDDTTDGELTLELVPGETYTLRMAAVGVGGKFETETGAEYIVDVSGNGETVPEGGTQRLVAQVRDKYNNPVSGVEITNTTNFGTATVRSVESGRTDADGRVTLEYTAPADVNDVEQASVTVSFGGNTSKEQRARFALEVTDADGSGGSGTGVGDPTTGGNPLNPASILQLADTQTVRTAGSNCESRSNNCDASVTIENKVTGTEWTVEGMRISGYFAQGDQTPTSVQVGDSQGPFEAQFNLNRDFTSVPLDGLDGAGEPEGQQTYYFRFAGYSNNPNNDGVTVGDFFVLEVEYEDETGDPIVVTYVVVPRPPA